MSLPLFSISNNNPPKSTTSGILGPNNTQKCLLYGQPFDLKLLASMPFYQRQIVVTKSDLVPGYQVLSELEGSEYLRINQNIGVETTSVLTSKWIDNYTCFFSAGIPTFKKTLKLDCSEEVKGKFLINARDYPTLTTNFDASSRRDQHLIWDLEHQRDFSFTLKPVCNLGTKLRSNNYSPNNVDTISYTYTLDGTTYNTPVALPTIDFSTDYVNLCSWEMLVEETFQWPDRWPDTFHITEWMALDFIGTHNKGPYETPANRTDLTTDFTKLAVVT